ncbi:MAG: type I secretion system permease/ATPase, partial [Janthinobacterium sp.]
MTPPPDTSTASAGMSTDALAEAIVFLARFFGTAVPAERLRAGVTAHGDPAAADFLDQALAHATLAGTALPAGQPRRATEMPALLINGAGQALVVLAIA